MPWIFVSLLLIIAIKMFGMLLALSFFKIEKEQRLALAALTTGCSEFVLIVLPSLRPVLGIDIANGIFFSVIVSMVLTPLFFSWAKKMMPKKNQSSSDIKIEPVVVVGFGTVGKSVAHILETNMIPFTIIDYKQTAVNQALEKGFLAIHGNINDMDFIKKATISDAKTLLLTFSKKNTPTLVRHLRSMMPLVSLCVKIKKDEEAEQLIGLGAQIVFPETTRLGIQMVSHALKNIGFSEDNVEKMIHIKKERNVFE
jgi:CPA2 family monovalent cation:H+ antiporter-2